MTRRMKEQLVVAIAGLWFARLAVKELDPIAPVRGFL